MDQELGARFKARREALGLSISALAADATVDRGRLTALEKGDPTVRQTTIGAVESALARREHEMGADTSDLVTGSIELPDGRRVTFSGPAEGVAEAAARFLAEREDEAP